MRRTIVTVLITMLVVLGLGGAVVAVRGDSSSVTRPRLERSLTATFANLYAAKVATQGGDPVTPASLDARAMCDKHGSENLDQGPGGDWVCLMSWTDPQVPMPPEGYGKFELNVHSNDCYTASGPSKLTGFLTMTDKDGREVPNPVFEFDGCFDPGADDSPTGVVFQSLLAVTSTSLTRDAQGKVGVQLTCGTGDQGCAGSLTVTAGKVALGTIDYDLAEESSTTLGIDSPVPAGVTEVTVEVVPTTGAGPTGTVTLPVA